MKQYVVHNGVKWWRPPNTSAFSRRIMRLSSPNQGSWQCPEISRVMNDLTKNPDRVCIASVLEVWLKLATGFLRSIYTMDTSNTFSGGNAQTPTTESHCKSLSNLLYQITDPKAITLLLWVLSIQTDLLLGMSYVLSEMKTTDGVTSIPLHNDTTLVAALPDYLFTLWLLQQDYSSIEI